MVSCEQEAAMMLADLMFQRNEHDAATFHFQRTHITHTHTEHTHAHITELLEKNPTQYTALHKLIQLLRRAGRLQDAPKFIKLAEKARLASCRCVPLCDLCVV